MTFILNPHKENTTRYVTVVFLNKDGDPELPASARYRIDNVPDASEVKGWTTISPIAATVEIVIPPAENAMVGVGPSEVREVTVEATYTATDKVTDSTQYTLVNLTFYPP